MKVPFHINITLNVNYGSSDEDRIKYKESVEAMLNDMGADIYSISAGPFNDQYNWEVQK